MARFIPSGSLFVDSSTFGSSSSDFVDDFLVPLLFRGVELPPLPLILPQLKFRLEGGEATGIAGPLTAPWQSSPSSAGP